LVSAVSGKKKGEKKKRRRGGNNTHAWSLPPNDFDVRRATDWGGKKRKGGGRREGGGKKKGGGNYGAVIWPIH